MNARIYGCSYDEFWWGDPKIFFWAEESYEISMRYSYEKADTEAWIAGSYVAEAIATTFSSRKKPHDYPGYPNRVETMDKALAEKRKLAELIKMRDQFLAVSSRMMPQQERLTEGDSE